MARRTTRGLCLLRNPRRPGREKPGVDPLDALVRRLGIRPIAGGDGRDETAGDGEQKSDGGKGQQNDGDGNGTQGDGKPSPKPDETPKFSQAQLDAIVKDRLDREREKGQREAEKAKREAEEAAATKNGEFQKLAEQRQERITALEGEVAGLKAVTDERDRYKAALESHLATQRQGLPKHVLELLDEMPVDKQLAWIAKNHDQIAGTGNGRVPSTPRANGHPPAKADEAYERLRTSGSFPRF